MAEDASNNLANYAKLECSMIEKLGDIRQWVNLSIAFDGDFIWLKGLRENQINSVEIKSIPNIKCFYANKGKLFPVGSNLPEGSEPSFLWTPIARGIKVEIPHHNHNFFEIQGKISLRLTEAKEEKVSAGMLTTLKILEAYAVDAPHLRLQNIEWVILNQDYVFLLGLPLLPIRGDIYWRTGDFLVPAGYDFDLTFLVEELNNKLNPKQLNLVVWDTESNYFVIDKLKMNPLTIGSLRKTRKNFKH